MDRVVNIVVVTVRRHRTATFEKGDVKRVDRILFNSTILVLQITNACRTHNALIDEQTILVLHDHIDLVVAFQ